LAAGCCASLPANAADKKLVCLLEDSVSHAQRALEIVFNERAQYVTVNGKTAIAGISDARITFRVELSDGAPLDFSVDRSSGSISIVSPNSSAKSRMVYTGQCKTTDST
jgi:hypothetical protein